MRFAVGTKNKAKLDSVRIALSRCKFVNTALGPEPSSDGGESDGHDLHEVIGVTTESNVSAQPFSAAETRQGALNRARGALELVPDADFGIGLEGGVEKAESDDTYFECGWMCVVERKTGRIGWGSSARFVLDGALVQQLKAGKELATVMDEMTGETDVRSGLGAMGILTGGALGRADAYSHGLIFAFAPFLSPNKYWVESNVKIAKQNAVASQEEAQ
jgi:inosine/xanthosine triphosphatase